MYMLGLMKRFLAPLIAFLSYLMLAPSAFAQAATPTPTPVVPAGALIDCSEISEPFNKLCGLDPAVLIARAISFIFVIAVVVAIFFLLLGALKWIYSGGDKAAVEGARSTITAAVIGLVILFLVFLVFTVILQFFGINILEIVIPTI